MAIGNLINWGQGLAYTSHVKCNQSWEVESSFIIACSACKSEAVYLSFPGMFEMQSLTFRSGTQSQ